MSEPTRYGEQPDVTGLARVACGEAHGLVWVTTGLPGVDPARDTAAVVRWLGVDVDRLLGDLGMGTMVEHRSADYALGCNWKMITDGFLETYHLRYLHRSTIAPYFPSNLTIVDRHADHFVAMLPKNRLLEIIADVPREQWEVLANLTMAITLVPGTVIQWQAGHVELFSLRPDPDHPGRCHVVVTMLVPADRAADTALWDRNWDRLVSTIPAEDFVAAEDVQANIDAGLVTALHLGATEHALHEHVVAIAALSTAD